MAQSTAGIKSFWSERFGANAHHDDWLREFWADIASTADQVLIDWAGCRHDAIVPGKMLKNNHVKTTDSKHRHFLELNWRETRGGIRYPIIQFTSHADGTVWWNGYEALAELFEREGGRQLNDVERDRIRQERIKREDARQEKAERNARKLRLQEKHGRQRQAIYRTIYDHGLRDVSQIATHPYAVRKRITPAVIAACGDMAPRLVAGKEFHKVNGQWLRGWRGWLAIPMIDLSGRYCGQQRIYSDGSKAHARGSVMSEAHLVIGDLMAADQLDYVEGFATGSSVYKAHQASGRTNVAVVVCFDKNGLSRIVRHLSHKYESKRHFIRADNDHFKWLEGKGNAGLMAALELAGQLHTQKVKVSAPNFDDISHENSPTDFNDLEVEGSLKLVQQQLSGRDYRLTPEKNMFLNRLQLLRLSGQKSFKKYAKRAAAAGASLIPQQLDRPAVAREILNAIPAQCRPSIKELSEIKRFLVWLVKNRFEHAAATKNFSDEALKGDNIQHIKVKAEIAEGGYPVIPASVLEMIRGLKGATILKAKHGTGKTERVMGPLMRETDGGASMIVHRVTLANQMAGELDLRHYKELDNVNVGWNTKMVSCVNSIIRPEFDWFWPQAELMCVDEATQVLRHVMGGADAIHAPVKAYNKLLRAARCADKVLLADADANDTLISFLNQARPGHPINIIEVESPAPDVTVNYCDNVAFVYQQVIDTARRKDKRILVATDSIKKAKALAEGVKLAWPEARVLCITADTKGEADAVEFSADPNRMAAQLDVLIYSPVISSGVSIRAVEASFDAHFGIFHGVVVPSDILQMLRRDRLASEYLVAFQPNHETHQTDRDAMLRGLLAAHEQSRTQLSWETTEEGVSIRTTAFDEMYLDVAISQAKARSDYMSHTLMLMAADGWKVAQAAVDELGAELGAEQMTMDKEVVRTARHVRIHANTTPDEQEYRAMKRAELITQDQAAQMARYEIEELLGVPVSDDAIEFLDNRGLNRIRRVETLRGTAEQVNRIENWEQQKGVVLTQRRHVLARWQLVNRIFDTLGLNKLSGAGEYSVDQARDVVAMLTGSQAAIDEYNALRIGPMIQQAPTCATRFVKGILERFVPVVNGSKRQGVQFYRLHPEKWAELNHYCAARAAKGQNALAQDSTADLHDDNLQTSELEAGSYLDYLNDPTPAAPAEASNGAGFSVGGEIIEHNIKHNSNFSPAKRDLLLSVLQWLKKPTTGSQFMPAEAPVDRLARLDALTIPNLLRLARGWIDPDCMDSRFGRIKPASIADLVGA